MLVGRVAEQRVLSSALASSEPELVAIYGRRRVGKTFLVRQFFKDSLVYELAGSFGAPVREQLGNHARALSSVLGMSLPLAPPPDWPSAFQQLRVHLERLRTKKRVVFFDELPWLAGRRSGFLRAFEHFWNAWASKQGGLVVVVCGSAASWMNSKLIAAKGGLHNRVTQKIRLLPFSLAEAKAFLDSRGVKLTPYGVTEAYLALGGVAHYLKGLKPGDSAAKGVARLCFSDEGILREEFETLYRSLFEHADEHVAIVRLLASRPSGMTREQVLREGRLKSGGGLTARLDELEQSGFVFRSGHFGRVTKDAVYRLGDEYSLFYLKWMGRRTPVDETAWLRQRSSPAWRAWSGLAFEGICMKHARELKRALGIEGVTTTESVFRGRSAGPDDRGAQIDLVIDRNDDCINLCELKFSEDEITITKDYARELRNKREVFARTTRTRKSLLITLVTTHGLRDNEHARDLVSAEVRLPALFREPF